MAYAEYSDAERLYGTEPLGRWLPKIEGATPQDLQALLGERLASASAMIDGYLAQGGYAVPLDLVALAAKPGGTELAARFRQCTVVLALYELAPGNKAARESLATARGIEMKWLREQVAKGHLSIQVAGPAKAPSFGVADPCAVPEIGRGLFHTFRILGGGS